MVSQSGALALIRIATPAPGPEPFSNNWARFQRDEELWVRVIASGIVLATPASKPSLHYVSAQSGHAWAADAMQV